MALFKKNREPTQVPKIPTKRGSRVFSGMPQSIDTRTYLDSPIGIEGQLSFDGPAQIDGQIEGEIVAQGDLVIGLGAVVKAKISAASVVVAGTVSGEISATERIELQSSAKMSGTIAGPRIAVHEGAVFEGNCTMTSKERRGQRNPVEVGRE